MNAQNLLTAAVAIAALVLFPTHPMSEFYSVIESKVIYYMLSGTQQEYADATCRNEVSDFRQKAFIRNNNLQPTICSTDGGRQVFSSFVRPWSSAEEPISY